MLLHSATHYLDIKDCVLVYEITHHTFYIFYVHLIKLANTKLYTKPKLIKSDKISRFKICL
ncbi:hypothetical protein NSMS1_17460 [Nostoc sp. MS1]|nr:hypothetical protein NSMS1_17460 [Nostoc sp. MS1]